jgi:hypothetical protein
MIEMGEVVEIAGGEVVDPDDGVTFGEQSISEV